MNKRLLLAPLSIAVILAVGIVSSSCDGGPFAAGLEDDLAPIHVTALAIGTPVSTLVVEVTAEDINRRLVFNIEVVGIMASGTIEVPPGESRTFTVTAFDDQHNVTHTGSETADVSPGSNPPLRVKLKPVAGLVEIEVTFGDYAVEIIPSTTRFTAIGQVFQLRAIVYDQDDETVPGAEFRWATTDPTIVSVSSSGLVTALADGEAAIVATYGGFAGVCEVTVESSGPPPTPSWQLQEVGTIESLRAVWGSSSNDVFAVGVLGTILHYDGTSWSPQVSGTGQIIYGVWGSSSTDVFAAGNSGTILHYNGSSWSTMVWGTNSLLDVWGTSSSDVFLVGLGGTIVHYSFGDWSGHVSGTSLRLSGVWGSSSNDVFAVGDVGTILHYDGVVWSAQVSGTAENLWDVWGSSSNDVSAVGDVGTILHYDGTSWTPQVSGTAETLWDVWGTSSTDVFAVGDFGTILHYDGTGWSPQVSGTFEYIVGVWGTSSTDVFAVGYDGVLDGIILHYTN